MFIHASTFVTTIIRLFVRFHLTKNEDNLKIKNDHQNENDLKNKTNLKNDPKQKDKLKGMTTISKGLPLPVVVLVTFFCGV